MICRSLWQLVLVSLIERDTDRILVQVCAGEAKIAESKLMFLRDEY